MVERQPKGIEYIREENGLEIVKFKDDARRRFYSFVMGNGIHPEYLKTYDSKHSMNAVLCDGITQKVGRCYLKGQNNKIGYGLMIVPIHPSSLFCHMVLPRHIRWVLQEHQLSLCFDEENSLAVEKVQEIACLAKEFDFTIVKVNLQKEANLTTYTDGFSDVDLVSIVHPDALGLNAKRYDYIKTITTDHTIQQGDSGSLLDDENKTAYCVIGRTTENHNVAVGFHVGWILRALHNYHMANLEHFKTFHLDRYGIYTQDWDYVRLYLRTFEEAYQQLQNIEFEECSLFDTSRAAYDFIHTHWGTIVYCARVIITIKKNYKNVERAFGIIKEYLEQLRSADQFSGDELMNKLNNV